MMFVTSDLRSDSDARGNFISRSCAGNSEKLNEEPFTRNSYVMNCGSYFYKLNYRDSACHDSKTSCEEYSSQAAV